jgi:hypothetical protein
MKIALRMQHAKGEQLNIYSNNKINGEFHGARFMYDWDFLLRS